MKLLHEKILKISGVVLSLFIAVGLIIILLFPAQPMDDVASKDIVVNIDHGCSVTVITKGSNNQFLFNWLTTIVNKTENKNEFFIKKMWSPFECNVTLMFNTVGKKMTFRSDTGYPGHVSIDAQVDVDQIIARGVFLNITTDKPISSIDFTSVRTDLHIAENAKVDQLKFNSIGGIVEIETKRSVIGSFQSTSKLESQTCTRSGVGTPTIGLCDPGVNSTDCLIDIFVEGSSTENMTIHSDSKLIGASLFVDTGSGYEAGHPDPSAITGVSFAPNGRAQMQNLLQLIKEGNSDVDTIEFSIHSAGEPMTWYWNRYKYHIIMDTAFSRVSSFGLLSPSVAHGTVYLRPTICFPTTSTISDTEMRDIGQFLYDLIGTDLAGFVSFQDPRTGRFLTMVDNEASAQLEVRTFTTSDDILLMILIISSWVLPALVSMYVTIKIYLYLKRQIGNPNPFPWSLHNVFFWFQEGVQRWLRANTLSSKEMQDEEKVFEELIQVVLTPATREHAKTFGLGFLIWILAVIPLLVPPVVYWMSDSLAHRDHTGWAIVSIAVGCLFILVSVVQFCLFLWLDEQPKSIVQNSTGEILLSVFQSLFIFSFIIHSCMWIVTMVSMTAWVLLGVVLNPYKVIPVATILAGIIAKVVKSKNWFDTLRQEVTTVITAALKESGLLEESVANIPILDSMGDSDGLGMGMVTMTMSSAVSGVELAAIKARSHYRSFAQIVNLLDDDIATKEKLESIFAEIVPMILKSYERQINTSVLDLIGNQIMQWSENQEITQQIVLKSIPKLTKVVDVEMTDSVLTVTIQLTEEEVSQLTHVILEKIKSSLVETSHQCLVIWNKLADTIDGTPVRFFVELLEHIESNLIPGGSLHEVASQYFLEEVERVSGEMVGSQTFVLQSGEDLISGILENVCHRLKSLDFVSVVTKTLQRVVKRCWGHVGMELDQISILKVLGFDDFSTQQHLSSMFELDWVDFDALSDESEWKTRLMDLIGNKESPAFSLIRHIVNDDTIATVDDDAIATVDDDAIAEDTFFASKSIRNVQDADAVLSLLKRGLSGSGKPLVMQMIDDLRTCIRTRVLYVPEFEGMDALKSIRLLLEENQLMPELFAQWAQTWVWHELGNMSMNFKVALKDDNQVLEAIRKLVKQKLRQSPFADFSEEIEQALFSIAPLLCQKMNTAAENIDPQMFLTMVGHDDIRKMAEPQILRELVGQKIEILFDPGHFDNVDLLGMIMERFESQISEFLQSIGHAAASHLQEIVPFLSAEELLQTAVDRIGGSQTQQGMFNALKLVARVHEKIKEKYVVPNVNELEIRSVIRENFTRRIMEALNISEQQVLYYIMTGVGIIVGFGGFVILGIAALQSPTQIGSVLETFVIALFSFVSSKKTTKVPTSTVEIIPRLMAKACQQLDDEHVEAIADEVAARAGLQEIEE